MKSKVREKEYAITLRKKGYSYNDILREVSVARSSLSLWLKDMPLTKKEKEVLKKRKDANISKGRIRAAATNKQRKVVRDELVRVEATEEFAQFIQDPLFHTGIALYWAEGAKRNKYFSFSNSDYEMIQLMLRWMELFLHVEREKVHARLYIHKPYAHERCEAFWAEKIGISEGEFKKTIYKPISRLVKKRPQYKGVLRINTNYEHLLKVKFWMQLFVEHHAKQ